MIGQTISHYKITEKLGEGGMGVVYKAEDTKLRRVVALKFLRSELIENPEHRERFLREAQAAAALDHPNICTIYEIDEDAGRTFLAMAFIEGLTVKDKIAQRPLKLDQALDIAVQTAQGLQAAHEKGIVHRDIKGANIMVTPPGQVKIMDFGLAQLAERSKLTETTTILGTPSYMSPEQARGEKTDRRADLWSLGVVLYEMIAGRLPFVGERQEAVLYGITSEEPEPVTAQRAGLPLELEWIIGKALAKDRDERYQHAEDVLVDLRSLQKKLALGKSSILKAQAGTPAVATQPAQTGQAAPGPLARYRVIEDAEEQDDGVVYHAEDTQLRRLVDVRVITQSAAKALGRKQLIRQAALFAAGVVLTILLGYATGWLGPAGAPAEVPLRRFSFAPADLVNAVISPNGKHIAYIERGSPNSLWVRDLDSERPRVLEGAVPGPRVFWSADSRFIGFQEGGDLKKVSREGGPAARVCELPGGNFGGGSWSSDGESIVFSSGSPFALYEAPSRGGNPKQLFDRVEEGVSRLNMGPRFLPRPGGARALLFNVRGGGVSHLFVRDLESGEMKKLGPGAEAAYSPSGHIVYRAAPNQPDLWALPFSLGTLDSTGEPFPIAQEAVSPSVAADGTLLYFDSTGGGLRQLVWRDREGKPLGTIGQPQLTIAYPALSPDGKRVATWSREGSAMDIWVHEVDRPVKSRLTTFGYDVWPTWSPSGRQIGFASGRTGERDIYVKSADGSGEPKALLLTDDSAEYLTDWSRDGKTLLFWRRPRGGGGASGSGTVGDIFYLRQKSGGDYEEFPFLTTKFEETTPQFSPDERFVAYTSDESGQREVYIQAFPEGGVKRQVSVNGGAQPRWRANGKEIYYVEGERLMAAPVALSGSLSVASPKELFSSPGLILGGGNYLSYDVTPDGQRFVLAERVESASRTEIHVVQNWFEEFRDRGQD